MQRKVKRPLKATKTSVAKVEGCKCVRVGKTFPHLHPFTFKPFSIIGVSPSYQMETPMSSQSYLIVGGSSGIGLSLAQLLHAQGHRVIVWSREARELINTPGIQHHAIDVVKDELPVDELPDQLNGLAYCPGSINLKPFRSLKPADFLRDFEVNLLGAVRCLQAVERRFKKADHTSVVLFSTVAVSRGMAFHASIAAAKGGIEGLTRSLAAEWAPKVRVNAIAPSLTDTPLAERLLSSEDKRNAAAERHPLKRIASAAEMADMAAYLLQPQARFITGQVIGIDGGLGVL